MTLGWIRPPQPRDLPLADQPRCDGVVRAPGRQLAFRRTHYSDPLRCRRMASCTIDGNNYCSLHGGEIALHRLLGEPLGRGDNAD